MPPKWSSSSAPANPSNARWRVSFVQRNPSQNEAARVAMSVLETWLADGLLITDGAWGTELQARGLPSGTNPDTWNLTHPDRVEEVARAYADAGCQIVLTNTFRANAIAMNSTSAAELDQINRA